MTLWVRVRDRDTRHEYDVPEGDERIGVLMDLVKSEQYPPFERQRPAKHYIDLAGRPATRSQPKPTGAGTPEHEEN